MNNSRRVESPQTGPHKDLEMLVHKHLNTLFRRPYSDYNLRTFELIKEFVSHKPGNIILDSGCGVGESTNRLAIEHPDSLVIGIDQSARRIAKHNSHIIKQARNYILLQANIMDIWRLAADAGWKLQKHYLLYPNPWPKIGHLRRRWHGSAVFPALLKMGGELELRSNWEIYLQEFQLALSFAGYDSQLQVLTPKEASTPFERKYHNSGQTLYQLTCHLDAERQQPVESPMKIVQPVS